jgi:response regulator RpfG family c-di-GMP phosphodiesterase
MRQHTTIGYHLVSNLRSMRLTAPIIRHHHERWDGSGYPTVWPGRPFRCWRACSRSWTSTTP